MSVWADLVGQDAAVATLRRAAEASSNSFGSPRSPRSSRSSRLDTSDGATGSHGPAAGMTHAWLLTGPPGSGRSTAARAFAAALQCAESPPGCGSCHDCRTALAGAHPDVTVVATEHVHLRVEDVRPLVTLAQQRPALGRWRVIVIEDADRLGDISGNVLLKAIEEPPARTVWLLCAPSPDDVLVTIRSRCRQVGLRIPPAVDVAALLVRRHGVEPAVAAYAAQAADSHVGLARRLATDEEARIRRREILRLPRQLSSVGAAVMAAGQLVEVATEEARSATAQRATIERAELLRALGAEGMSTLPPPVRAQVRVLEENQKRRATRAQRDVLDRALVDLTSFYRDVLMVQLRAPVELTNADLLPDLEKVAVASSAESTLVRMEAIGLARERIGANVAALLAVEAMMVTLLFGAVPAAT